MLTTFTLRLLAAVLVGGALLAGCAGSKKHATRFYVLSELAHDTPALAGTRRDPPLALDIAALRLPQYLSRPQIVTRTADNELAVAEYHQWGGNLARDMMRVLARNLSRLLDTAEITLFSRRPPKPANVRVEMEVLRFERGPDARVLLSVQWRLLRGTDGTPLLARITDLDSAPVPEGAGMAGTVAAMSDSLAELSRTVARAVLSVTG